MVAEVSQVDLAGCLRKPRPTFHLRQLRDPQNFPVATTHPRLTHHAPPATMTSLSFSLNGPPSNSSRRPSPPPTKTNGTKRNHATLLDDASDDEDATTHTKRQTITHFDTAVGGSINAKATKKEERTPLVITALANRDWRDASKRQRAQKYGISAEQLDARKDAQHAEGSAKGADTVVKETDAVKYGLNVFAPSSTVPEDIVQEEQPQEEEVPQHKTQDQLAIDALTGAAPTSTLTIPAAAATEEEAFASTFHSAPPAPSLSDYTAVPVEEYGAAMLRGMGWKGPATSSSSTTKSTKKPLPPPKRPALLGIGADPTAAKQAEELGAWGKSSSRQRGKEPTMFIPVSMKNKRTGETLTEEELKNKIRKDKEEAENQRFIVNDLEIRGKSSNSSRRDDGGSRRKDDYEDDQEERRRRRDKERDHDRHDKAKDHRDRRDRSRDHRDSKRDSSRDRYDKKSSSHRRDRSRSISKSRDHDRRDRDRDYNRRDRDKDYDRRARDDGYDKRDKPKDYERKDRDRRDKTESGKRDRYEDGHKSSSRRDRDGRDGEGYRSSRR
jgi:hypothetical protein